MGSGGGELRCMLKVSSRIIPKVRYLQGSSYEREPSLIGLGPISEAVGKAGVERRSGTLVRLLERLRRVF